MKKEFRFRKFNIENDMDKLVAKTMIKCKDDTNMVYPCTIVQQDEFPFWEAERGGDRMMVALDEIVEILEEVGMGNNRREGVVETPQPRAAPAPEKPKITADVVIAKYIETRDLIAEKKKAFEAEKADLDALQEKRASWLMGSMDKLGVTSLKAAVGTCFVDYKDSATVADKEEFLSWVKAEWEERKSYMDTRVSKTAVKQRLEDGETLPPGVSYTKIKDIKIRRA